MSDDTVNEQELSATQILLLLTAVKANKNYAAGAAMQQLHSLRMMIHLYFSYVHEYVKQCIKHTI